MIPSNFFISYRFKNNKIDIIIRGHDHKNDKLASKKLYILGRKVLVVVILE